MRPNKNVHCLYTRRLDTKQVYYTNTRRNVFHFTNLTVHIYSALRIGYDSLCLLAFLKALFNKYAKLMNNDMCRVLHNEGVYKNICCRMLRRVNECITHFIIVKTAVMINNSKQLVYSTKLIYLLGPILFNIRNWQENYKYKLNSITDCSNVQVVLAYCFL